VKQFKYLGVMLHERRRYAECMEYRLVQAKRMVAMWMRRCSIWMLPIDVVSHQFKTCIMPALEYGVSIWGVGRTYGDIAAWEKIECFWRSIARTILGLPVRSPSEGVVGELGWHPFETRAGWQAAAFWTRVSEIDDRCLARKAMHVQRRLVQQDRVCWLRMLRDTLTQTPMGSKYWMKWYNDPCFRVKTVNERNERWEDSVREALEQRAESIHGERASQGRRQSME
jgi:hypothetical protein